MKKYFKNKKLVYLVVTILTAVVFYGIIASTLHAESSYVPEDNVKEMNYERSRVYVDGEGYQLDSYVKKATKEKKEDTPKPIVKKPIVRRPVVRRPIINRTPVRRSVTPQRRTQPKKETPKKEKPKKEKPKKEKPKKDKEEVSEDPVISISLKNGEKISGKTAKFTVTAESFDGDPIPAGKITVKMNEERLLENGEDTYIGTVIDGENIIVVTAEDDKGRKSKITRKINGNPEAPPKKIGSLKVMATASVLGIEVVAPKKSVDIYENEQLSDVVTRYFDESSGVSMVDVGTGHFEVGRIEKSGIIDEIPEEIIAQLEEQGISMPEDKDSLGHNDFGPSSGWMYKVDGTAPNQYMSSEDPIDGSEVEIYYTITAM